LTDTKKSSDQPINISSISPSTSASTPLSQKSKSSIKVTPLQNVSNKQSNHVSKSNAKVNLKYRLKRLLDNSVLNKSLLKIDPNKKAGISSFKKGHISFSHVRVTLGSWCSICLKIKTISLFLTIGSHQNN
jgi:hypothetical protein